MRCRPRSKPLAPRLRLPWAGAVAASLALAAAWPALALASPPSQALDPTPPDHTVRLVFIHHSTGENWLRDDYGALGLALADNHYFVSDTNYGWGPDAIGDRTDIPDWPEWFVGSESQRYLQALYAEDEAHSEYSRPLANPGGENEIVLFKSCFPNSDLGGEPDDPPAHEADFTVGGAKYVYNQLLDYFRTRPDRLFIVITAPPLSDPAHAANARAFNDWLVNDWLDENAYPYANVAVFDFYNILTGPDNHHRSVDGQIEHVYQPGGDISYYPSSPGDDHPSAAASRRATDEFVPLLNVFYNRWRAASPAPVVPADGPVSPPPEDPAAEAAAPQAPGGVIDGFEAGAPAGTEGWTAYAGETPGTTIDCGPSPTSARSGALALQIEFSVPTASWATCLLSYWEPQDWSGSPGVLIPLQADRAGVPYTILLYAGTAEAPESYISYQDTPTDSVGGWATIEIPWASFRRVDWEEDGGTPFSRPDQIGGIGLGFDGLDSGANTGLVRVDDLQLMGSAALPAGGAPAPAEEPGPGFSCPGAAALAALLPALVVFRRRPA